MYFIDNNLAGDKRLVKVKDGNFVWESIYDRDPKNATDLTRDQERELFEMVKPYPNAVLERIYD